MATGTTVFTRLTVVAPRTRIDVALPADVAVADIQPMLLDMAKETAADGGVRHGGWCLAKLGEPAPLDPGRTLASLGVVDGDLLQLRKRSDNPPPPLYDDVVDAIAESTPDSFRPWTKETAHKFGHAGAGLALVAAAVAVLFGGPLGGGASLPAAIAAGITAIVALSVGATVARSYHSPTTGVLIAAAGGLPMAFVCGVYVVPGYPGATNLLLGSALVLILSIAAVMLVQTGTTTFVAAGTAGLLGALGFLIGSLLETPAAGIAGGAAAVALGLLTALPRITIQLAKLPLPHVPSNAEDLREDGGFPDYRVIEERAGRAHEFMTGMIIGCGLVAAVSAVIASGSGNVWGMAEGACVALVLLLRGRTYANGSQAMALLATGILTAGGLLVGWLIESTATMRLLAVFAALVVIAVGTLLVGIVFPEQRFSPVLRRSVDVIESLLIVAVVPLALAVLNLYSAVRHVHIG